MPWCSSGFCVAMTRNGLGSSNVWSSIVTLPSCIASSRPLWVRGGARLISSARTMFVKIGPGLVSKSAVCGLYTDTPSTSDGSRSDVNWILWKPSPRVRARACESVVLPTPGTSSKSTCPRARSAASARRTTSRLPWNTDSTSWTRCSRSSRDGRDPRGGAVTDGSDMSEVVGVPSREGGRRRRKYNTGAGSKVLPGTAGAP